MKTLVLGVDGIVGRYGAAMAASGSDVTFLAWPERDARATRISHVLSPGPAAMKYPVLTLRKVGRPFDLVLCAAKSSELATVIETLRPAVHEGTVLVPVVNSTRHLAALDQAFQGAYVLGASCGTGPSPTQLGEVPRHARYLIVGPRTPAQDTAAASARHEIGVGGLRIDLSEVIMRDIWENLVLVCMATGVAAFIQHGFMARGQKDDVSDFASRLFAECSAAASAAGYAPQTELADLVMAVEANLTAPDTAAFSCNLLREWSAERSCVANEMLASAVERGTPTQAIRQLTELLQGIGGASLF